MCMARATPLLMLHCVTVTFAGNYLSR